MALAGAALAVARDALPAGWPAGAARAGRPGRAAGHQAPHPGRRGRWRRHRRRRSRGGGVMSSTVLIAVIVALAVGTYAFRLSGIVLRDRLDLPERVTKVLPIAAAALLGALAATATLFTQAGELGGVRPPGRRARGRPARLAAGAVRGRGGRRRRDRRPAPPRRRPVSGPAPACGAGPRFWLVGRRAARATRRGAARATRRGRPRAGSRARPRFGARPRATRRGRPRASWR